MIDRADSQLAPPSIVRESIAFAAERARLEEGVECAL